MSQTKTGFEFVGLHKAVAGNSPLKRRKRQSLIPAYENNTVFDFDLQSTLASHLAGGFIMGFLRQLSERLLRVLAQHDNATA